MGTKAPLMVFGDVKAALWDGAEPDRAAAEAVVRALHSAAGSHRLPRARTSNEQSTEG